MSGSYFIFNNRYKIAFSISFLLTTGLLVLFSNIPVKEVELKTKPVIIRFSKESSKEIIEEALEDSIPVETPKDSVTEEPPKEIIEEALDFSIPVETLAQKEIIEEVAEIAIPVEAPKAGDDIENIALEIADEVINHKSEYIEIDSLPESTVIVEPKYPKSAIKWNMEGIVEVDILVLENGKISTVNLIKSSGHKVLDNQCIKTIKNKWVLPDLGEEYKVFKRFVFQLK